MQAVPVSLKLPSELKTRLSRAARAEHRSMNSQIIVLLERALPAEKKEAETAPTVPASN